MRVRIGVGASLVFSIACTRGGVTPFVRDEVAGLQSATVPAQSPPLYDIEGLARRRDNSVTSAWSLSLNEPWPHYLEWLEVRLQTRGYVRHVEGYGARECVFTKHRSGDVFLLQVEAVGDPIHVHLRFIATGD